MLVPMTREATVSCVSLDDPAVDRDKLPREVLKNEKGEALVKEPISVYLTKRLRDPSSWRTLVPMKDGAKPTEFIIGVIPPAELNRIEDECRGETHRAKELTWRSFLHGLRDIKGLGLDIKYHEVGGVRYVDPQWIADVFCGHLREVACEIGTIVYNWNHLSPEDMGN